MDSHHLNRFRYDAHSGGLLRLVEADLDNDSTRVPQSSHGLLLMPEEPLAESVADVLHMLVRGPPEPKLKLDAGPVLPYAKLPNNASSRNTFHPKYAAKPKPTKRRFTETPRPARSASPC